MDYLISRLREPTTWAGIITFATGIVHYALPPDVAQSITNVAVFVVGALFVGAKEAKQ